MPRIEVHRISAGYTEHLAPFEVVIDGEPVGLLGPGESRSFDVAEGVHTLCTRIYWCGSEMVDVDVGEDEPVAFSCETRARFLTDAYWASLGRHRYLRLSRVPVEGAAATGVPVTPRTSGGSQIRPRRVGIPLFLLVGAGLSSFVWDRGLDFLTSMSLIFLLVQAIIALNFHLLSPRLGARAGIKSHDPFRFRIGEELILAGCFAVAGLAGVVGLLHVGGSAGWLALAAASAAAANVLTALRNTAPATGVRDSG